MIERVVDTFVVVAIASVAILVLSVRGIVASAVLAGLAVTALLIVGVAAGIAAHRLPGAARVAAFLERWPRVRAALVRLREGLAVASDARTVGLAVALSIASWSCTVLAFAAAAQAVGVRADARPGGAARRGHDLATAIPAGPGYIGTYELAVAVAIGDVGRDRPRGGAGVRRSLVHLATLLVTSVGGAARLLPRLTVSRSRRRRLVADRSRDAIAERRRARTATRLTPIADADDRTRPRRGAGARSRVPAMPSGSRGLRYLTRPWALSQVETTSLMSFLSTLDLLVQVGEGRRVDLGRQVVEELRERRLVGLGQEVVADQRRDVVGRLRLLVVLEQDEVVRR